MSQLLLGAIIGDIVGSPYEFDRGEKTKDFPLFSEDSMFTDDTVMTIAILDALTKDGVNADDDTIRHNVQTSMQYWGHRYPHAGYGVRFMRWLHSPAPNPYNSCGNGSAMRVSPAAWLAKDLGQALHLAKLTAEVTHNHPEGIKGAQATAAAIYLARTGSSKAEIRTYITETFGYDLTRSCDAIRPAYRHVETCQKTVPEAITAFLEGKDFEDVFRTAVSLGGDCDTLTAIAASIAEAYYPIPNEIRKKALSVLDDSLLKSLETYTFPMESCTK